MDLPEILKMQFGGEIADIRTYSPLALAYIGDGIYDLVIRTLIVRHGSCQPNKLHKRTSALVKASAQSALIDKLMDKLTEEELAEVDGIGPVIARSFVEYFAKEGKNVMIDHLLSHLKLKAAPQVNENQKFTGINFVITGNVNRFANRNEVKAEIEKRGGKVTGSVTSKTNYLINNDVASGSSKNKKAKELGIPIISEEDFIRMLEEQ